MHANEVRGYARNLRFLCMPKTLCIFVQIRIIQPRRFGAAVFFFAGWFLFVGYRSLLFFRRFIFNRGAKTFNNPRVSSDAVFAAFLFIGFIFILFYSLLFFYFITLLTIFLTSSTPQSDFAGSMPSSPGTNCIIIFLLSRIV